MWDYAGLGERRGQKGKRAIRVGWFCRELRRGKLATRFEGGKADPHLDKSYDQPEPLGEQRTEQGRELLIKRCENVRQKFIAGEVNARALTPNVRRSGVSPNSISRGVPGPTGCNPVLTDDAGL